MEFNEQAYLRANPDVAAAVQAGRFASGWEHYRTNGVHEGRDPNPGITIFGLPLVLLLGAVAVAAVVYLRKRR